MKKWFLIFSLLLFLVMQPGCGTVRVTDPYATASQLFLESEATRLAVSRVSAQQLRDRKVFVDPTYLTVLRENSDALSFKQIPQTFLFLLAELRAKLLLNGVRLVEKREDADIVVEARSGGVGVDHQEFLLGIPNLTLSTSIAGDVPFQTPELAILKSTKQFGFASIAFVAYWRDTGELVSSSGPFVGRTSRADYWIVGLGPYTSGNIPPAQKPPPESTTGK